MKKQFGKKIKLVLIIGICGLFITVAFSSAIGEQINERSVKVKTGQDPISPISPILGGLFNFRFLNRDWNYWDNKPNLFSMPSGNVGIGTMTPDDRLDVVGMIHSTSGGFKFPDNTTQNSAAAGDGHSLNAADGNPVDVVFVDNDGSVIINTSGVQPNGRRSHNPNPNVQIKADNNVGVTAGNSVSITAGTDLDIKAGGNVNIASTMVIINGKLTVHGGIDPPYISLSKESHDSIRDYAKHVGDREEVMQFWDGDAHRMEIYVISEDAFYTLTGEMIQE